MTMDELANVKGRGWEDIDVRVSVRSHFNLAPLPTFVLSLSPKISLELTRPIATTTAFANSNHSIKRYRRSDGRRRTVICTWHSKHLLIGRHVQCDWRGKCRMNKARCTCDQKKRRTPRLGRQRADKKQNPPDKMRMIMPTDAS